ncbi:HEAT repeat domain-containing protein [Cellulophaga sp. F20128]|uniref:HEAT repeat domain-containing protein n=1 Tax=Cellulophaga sp. F20128 TaxID=2926413 RepID=UPI001FF2F785|nr:HEAT repeat domain-containing protein [Cellulophaga sp. F20128]MCK0155956.1 HEAT repeat domain-containing protein [Cellulophaga sp. F20128]
MKYLAVKDAINGFIGYATIHGMTTGEIPDSKIANLSYKGIVEAFEYIKNENAFTEMKALLSHENFKVRSWSARYLLNVYEKEALKVLEDIANGETNSFNAKMIIKEWKEGNLTF